MFGCKYRLIVFETFVFMMIISPIGCKTKNGDKKAIETTAYNYILATSNYQIDDAVPYATKETREKTLPFIKNVLMPLTDTSYLKNNTPAVVTIIDITLLSDTAIVDYLKKTPLESKNGSIMVIKENGQWLVDVPLNLPTDDSTNDSLVLTVPATKQVINTLKNK